MFGCTKTLRNWSAEGKGSTPTHVSLYDTDNLNIAESGLGREGMVLVALMSGGDYLPDGIPGCGVKVACEAAKAGFGKSICRLKASDEAGLRAWRESLIHELRTNEGRHFRTKHKALTIPENFPNLEVLRYYTHPVVSPLASLDAIRQKLSNTGDPDVLGLREFARETFAWDFRAGAIYLVRKLAPALLVHRLWKGHPEAEGHIKRISGRRTHFSADATPELRLAYVPQEIVPIDVSQEVEETTAYGRDGLALNSDDEFEAADSLAQSSQSAGKVYDISKPDLVWVLEEVAKKTAPATVQAWEEAQLAKTVRKSPKKAAATRGKKAPAVPPSTLDQFVKISKAKASSSSAAPISKPMQPKEPKDLRAPKPLLRRPQTPPREPSKQPSAKRDLVSRDPFRTIENSPVAPRTPDASFPEPILISSSPPDAPVSPSPRPRFTSRSKNPGSYPMAPSSSAETLTKSSRNKRPEHFTPKASQEGRYKQMTLDMFATRTKYGAGVFPSTRKDSGSGSIHTDERDDFDDFLEVNSSPMKPPSPVQSSSSALQSTSSSKRNQMKSESGPHSGLPAAKKLLVPRTSDIGFFREVEVEEHEVDAVIDRETARLRSRGIRTAVARWSDVSVIDLTQDDA